MKSSSISGYLLAISAGFIAGIAIAQKSRVVGIFADKASIRSVETDSPRRPVAPPTPEQKQLKADLQEAWAKKRLGDYVLDSDIPALRDRLAELERKAVDSVMDERDGEYAELYSKLGIDATTSAQLRQHLALIYKAKVHAGLALQDFHQAKSAYDRRLQKLLGQSNYELYSNYEAAQPARREYAHFSDFLSKNSAGNLDASEVEIIERLFQQSQAYSPKTLSKHGGPFEDIDPPISGRRVEPYMQAKNDAYRQSSALMMGEVRKSSLSPSTVNYIQNYLGQQLEAAERDIEVSGAAGLQIRMFTKMLEQERAKPKPDASAIAMMQGELEKLRAGQSPRR